MSDRETMRRTLMGFLEAETGEKVTRVEDGKKIREELGLDSVDVVSIVMQIECHYRIRLTHQELESVVKVGDLLDLIGSKVAVAQEEPSTL